MWMVNGHLVAWVDGRCAASRRLTEQDGGRDCVEWLKALRGGLRGGDDLEEGQVIGMPNIRQSSETRDIPRSRALTLERRMQPE